MLRVDSLGLKVNGSRRIVVFGDGLRSNGGTAAAQRFGRVKAGLDSWSPGLDARGGVFLFFGDRFIAGHFVVLVLVLEFREHHGGIGHGVVVLLLVRLVLLVRFDRSVPVGDLKGFGGSRCGLSLHFASCRPFVGCELGRHARGRFVHEHREKRRGLGRLVFAGLGFLGIVGFGRIRGLALRLLFA